MTHTTVEEPTRPEEPACCLDTVPESIIPPDDYMTKEEQLEHVATMQCSAKRGLQVFGEEGAQAIMKEMKQLNIRNVMEPALELTREQKKKALEHLVFLKKK